MTHPIPPSYSARYTFSGKEKDSETGYSYFGARYYSSDLSVWLSVDPMSDKYPGMSPYSYCAGNPVRLVDLWGEEWEVNEAGYIRQVGDIDNNTLYAVKGARQDEFGERRTTRAGDFIALEVDGELMNNMHTNGTDTKLFSQNKRSEMISLFNFLADNTDVEWEMAGFHIDIHSDSPTTIIQDILHTEHGNTQCTSIIGYGKRSDVMVLDYHRHSHPQHYTGNDRKAANSFPATSNWVSPNDMQLKSLWTSGDAKAIQPHFILRNRGKDYYY